MSAPETQPRHRPAGRALFRVALPLVILSVLAYYPDTAGDSDLGWHLRYGQHIVTGRTTDIRHGDFAWTATEEDWRTANWGAQSILYLVHGLLGYPGLWILQWALYLGAILLFWTWHRRRAGPPDLVTLLSVLAFFVAIRPTAIHIKPEIFTTFLFALVVSLYFEAKTGGRDRLLLLPVVFLAWANCHGGFVVGLTFVALAAAGELLAGRLRRPTALPPAPRRHLLAGAALSLVAVNLNPCGPGLLIRFTDKVLHSGAQEQLFNVAGHLNRWRFLWPDSLLMFQKTCTAWLLLAMMAALAVLWLRARRRRRGPDPVLLAVNLFFFVFAMQLARAVLFFPLIWLFTVSVLLSDLGRRERDRLQRALLPGLAVLLLCGPFYTAAIHYGLAWGGSGLDEIEPREELAFARRAGLPGRLFNDFLSGGHLIQALGAARPVFIDSRFQPFAGAFLSEYARYMSDPQPAAFADLDAKYGFGSAFLNHATAFAAAAPLLRSPQWDLVYVGRVASVFVRRDLLRAEHTADLAAHTDPERFAGLRNWQLLYGLFQVYLHRDPDDAARIAEIYRRNVSPWFVHREDHLREMEILLAQTRQPVARLGRRHQTRMTESYLAGRLDDARAAAAAYLELFPEDGAVTYNLACLEARLGRAEAAWQALQRALALGYRNFDQVRRDNDLAGLRQRPDFAALLAGYETADALTRRAAAGADNLR